MEWRTLPWLHGYEISEYGHLRSTSDKPHSPAGKILRPSITDGYQHYAIWMNGTRRTLREHRLVCEAFHGPCPDDKAQVAHNDGGRANNHYSNLRWATAAENAADRLRHGTHLRGEKVGNSKLTDDQVQEIRARLLAGETHKSIADRFGCTRQHISAIARAKKWAHIVPQRIASRAVNANKRFCKRGHPFDEENTAIDWRGDRRCRTCHRDRERERGRAKRTQQMRREMGLADDWRLV